MTMLGILRGTQKALFFACICLLVCSFERLSRYEFASREKEEEDPQLVRPTDHARPKEPPSSGEDHFVFWAGTSISNHWERTVEQGLLHNHRFLSKLFGFGGFSFSTNQSIVPASSDRSRSGRSRSSAATDMITTSLTTRILNYQDLVAPLMTRNNNPNTNHATAPIPLAEAKKLALRRPIRQSQKMHGNNSGPKSEPDDRTSTRHGKIELPSNENAKEEELPPSMVPNMHQKLPRIGFVLHLTECDRHSIQQWQTFWTNQLNGRDQPFLFHILLPSTASQENCWKELQVEPRKGADNSMMIYNISQDDQMALALQTSCKSPNEQWLDRFHMEELVYHDGSKSQQYQLRSRANTRLFRKKHGDSIATIVTDKGFMNSQGKGELSADTQSAPSPSFASFFQCSGGAQTSAHCDGSVLDCPSKFQYVPPAPQLVVTSRLDSKRANGGPSAKNKDELPKSITLLEATTS